MTRTRKKALERLNHSLTFQKTSDKKIKEGMIAYMVVAIFGTEEQSKRIQKKTSLKKIVMGSTGQLFA